MAISMHLSKTALNVNELNAIIKRVAHYIYETIFFNILPT